MDRRQFGIAIAALGLAANAQGERAVQIDRLQLSRNGWMPNNDRLPVLHYHRAFPPSPTSGDAADAIEATLARNQWPAQWRNGVYTFHHYHSTAHEVLGIAAGSAVLTLGGEGGHNLPVEAGDLLVLPTGTGHFLLQAHPGFLVVGAYPVGQTWDICRAAPTPAAVDRMSTLPFPQSDPFNGKAGELPRAWN